MMGRAAGVVVRPARGSDLLFVRHLAAAVFQRLGDYERMVGEFFESTDVATWIAEEGGRSVGFAMARYDLDRYPEVDLVAIAVDPSSRRRGVGRSLLERVEVEVASAWGGHATIALTVAVDNAPARRLFEGAGYRSVPKAYGIYPRGQLSRGMRKRLTEHRD